MEQFDVVVVGARCAGSPLATMLARRGLRVCVVDRARFPSETPSTHVVQPCGVLILERLGVLEAVRAAGAVPLDRFTLVNEDVRISAEVAGAPGLCIRRLTLDALLVDAATAAGAQVRTGTKATGLLQPDGRVVGIETEQGAIQAALVVGADGRHSSVAAMAGAGEYHVTPGGRRPAWAYFDEVANPEGRLRLARRGDLAFLACPTDSGLYMAGVAPPSHAMDAFLADRDANFAAGLAEWPELTELLAGASRVGPIRVMSDWHGYFRQATGAGWVLVGDAGHFKDFTPAQGISDALRQAERLAEAIETGLGGTGHIDDELSRWWRWRDKDAHEMHWFATDMGAPGPVAPLVLEFMRGIARDEQATADLLRVLNHDIPPSQLLTTTRVLKAVARAARERPPQIPALSREIASELRIQIRRSRATHKAPTNSSSAPRPTLGRRPRRTPTM